MAQKIFEQVSQMFKVNNKNTKVFKTNRKFTQKNFNFKFLSTWQCLI